MKKETEETKRLTLETFKEEIEEIEKRGFSIIYKDFKYNYHTKTYSAELTVTKNQTTSIVKLRK